MKVSAAAALVAAVVIVGFKSGWFGEDAPPPAAVSEDTPADTTTGATPGRPERFAPLRPRGEGPPSAVSTPAPSVPRPSLPKPTEVPRPEMPGPARFNSVDDVLASSLDDTQKVAQILALLPRLSAEDQEEAIQHASNLVSDEAYEPLGKMLIDTSLSEGVLDALLTDVLNRSDSLKLPMLLKVARQPNHPLASDAKDVLEVYLEKDYGNDWAATEAAIAQWLKENAEDEPQAQP
ncbi:MAG TPA: hypothetical protein VNO52_13365 [Methylomirabilota bacterium]|nr:hypothetical protein [Methylomirabilota bacterium]